MDSPRVEALERMLQSRPDDPRLRFGLALEYEKAGRAPDAVRELAAYLAMADDEGNAWGRLGALLRGMRRNAEAQDAYSRGIEAASRHGHPTMAEDFRAILEGWDP